MPILILQRNRDRHVEHGSAVLIEPHRDFAGPDGGRIAERRHICAMYPPGENPIERSSRGGFNGALEVVRPGLLEFPVVVELAKAIEKGLVADESPKHVQDQRAFVVNDGAEDTSLPLDETEAVAQVDRSLI